MEQYGSSKTKKKENEQKPASTDSRKHLRQSPNLNSQQQNVLIQRTMTMLSTICFVLLYLFSLKRGYAFDGWEKHSISIYSKGGIGKIDPSPLPYFGLKWFEMMSSYMFANCFHITGFSCRSSSSFRFFLPAEAFVH